MSDEYKMVLSMGGHEIVTSGPVPDWVSEQFWEIFEKSMEPAKKLPTGFSVTGGQFEVSYE